MSVSLDAAAERPPVEQRGGRLPLLRAPDIEARVGVGLGWELEEDPCVSLTISTTVA